MVSLGEPIVPGGPRATSRAAAASVRQNAETDELRVLLALHRQADTDDGIEVRLKMRHQTASARRRGLVIKGFVEDSGGRAETRSGRTATVWVVTTKGREFCERHEAAKKARSEG